MANIVDKSTDNAEPLSICFLYLSNQRWRKFFLAFAWHFDARGVVLPLIDNGEQANQIASIRAIVIKYDYKNGPCNTKNKLKLFQTKQNKPAQFSGIFLSESDKTWKKLI